MPVQITVKISPRMYREDAEALRTWLEREYAIGWTEHPEADRGDSLSVADLVLVGLLTGGAEAVGKAAAENILRRIKQIGERYDGELPPPAEVAAEPVEVPIEVPETSGAEQPGQADHDAP